MKQSIRDGEDENFTIDIMKEEIEWILNDRDPSLEPEILDYLGGILAKVEEPLDGDEQETLQSTLEHFLNPAECQAFLSVLSQTHH
jgi:hypothetical protein